MLIWFEPERMWKAVGLWNKGLENGKPDNNNSLLALNDNEAADLLIELISSKIKELSLSWYRQDYNILPLSYWKYTDEQDGEHRTGVTQIKYINNLYRFWDTILERYPHLIIDNCAGGGHRIDIETLGRSVPLWRSDYQCIWDNCPEANQIQNSGAAWWYPYSGIGFGPTLGDTYSFRSAYTAGLTIRTWEHADPEWEVGAMNEPLDWAKKYFDEYNSIRDYFSCDFYQLIKNACDNVSWSASQFDKPEDHSGIILAFRRAMCPNPTAEVTLGGVDVGKTYEFTDIETGITTSIKGSELKKNGMTLTIPNKRQSLLIKYRCK